MSLAGVDGVGDRQVVDHPLLPVLLGPLLPGQAVVEAGQAGALKGGHSQDVLEEDSTAGRREATQRMTCTHRGRVSVCWTCWKSLCWSCSLHPQRQSECVRDPARHSDQVLDNFGPVGTFCVRVCTALQGALTPPRERSAPWEPSDHMLDRFEPLQNLCIRTLPPRPYCTACCLLRQLRLALFKGQQQDIHCVHMTWGVTKAPDNGSRAYAAESAGTDHGTTYKQ